MSKHPPVTKSIIVKAYQRKPASVGELGRLCSEEMDTSGWPELADPDEFANALIEKGAVSIGVDGRCEVPIPSMAMWAGAAQD